MPQRSGSVCRRRWRSVAGNWPEAPARSTSSSCNSRPGPSKAVSAFFRSSQRTKHGADIQPQPGEYPRYRGQCLKEQANAANKDVNDAIKALQGTDNADNPALLAELQHKINKWSVIYNINSTVTRALRDLMQGILQKI